MTRSLIPLMQVMMQEENLKEEGFLLAVKGSGRCVCLEDTLFKSNNQKKKNNWYSRWHRGRVISKGSTMSVVKIVLIDSGNLLLLPPWKVPPLEEISH